jgi:hypothetical protein
MGKIQSSILLKQMVYMTRLLAGRPELDSQRRQDTLLFSKAFRPAPGENLTSYPMGAGSKTTGT